MNQVFKAYSDFWGQFVNPSKGKPIKTFPEGLANEQDGDKIKAPSFPYITYPIIRPGFTQSAIGTASIWDKSVSEPGFLGLVSDVLEQVAETIPEEGIIIKTSDTGAIWIQRGSNFMNIIGDPSDPAIVRGVVNLVIRSHVL